MDEPDDLAKAAILEWLNKEYEKDPNRTFLAEEFHIKLKKEMEGYGFDTIEKTMGLVKIMAESGQLRENHAVYRITNKGREDLHTIYNDDWIVEQMKIHKNKNKKEEEDKIQKFNLEERRHQEMVKAAKEGNSIQRIGIVIALALGALGLIIAVFKP